MMFGKILAGILAVICIAMLISLLAPVGALGMFLLYGVFKPTKILDRLAGTGEFKKMDNIVGQIEVKVDREVSPLTRYERAQINSKSLGNTKDMKIKKKN